MNKITLAFRNIFPFFGWDSHEVRVESQVRLNILPIYILSLISFFILLFFLLQGLQDPIWRAADQRTYKELAESIRQDGLFNLNSAVRTYLYPLWIAIIQIFSLTNEFMTRIFVSLSQWILLLFVAYASAKLWVKLSQRKCIGILIFASIVLNPWLIQASTLLLTDVVFSALCLLSLTLFFESNDKVNRWMLYSPWLMACATMIRPAGIFFFGMIMLLVILRMFDILTKTQKDKNCSKKKIMILVLGLILIFSPQLYMNKSKFGKLKITPVYNFFNMQVVAGLTMFKYRTIVNPDRADVGALVSLSPVVTPTFREIFDKNESFFKLVTQYPTGFAMAGVAHMLSLLDWDELYTYAKDVGGFWRLFFSLFLYAYWFIGGYGILQAFREPRSLVAKRTIGMFIFCAIYTAPLLLAAVEARFGYLIYMLFGPAFAMGMLTLYEQKHSKIRSQRMFLIGVFILFVFIMLSYSIYCDYLTGHQFLLFRYIHWFT